MKRDSRNVLPLINIQLRNQSTHAIRMFEPFEKVLHYKSKNIEAVLEELIEKQTEENNTVRTMTIKLVASKLKKTPTSIENVLSNLYAEYKTITADPSVDKICARLQGCLTVFTLFDSHVELQYLVEDRDKERKRTATCTSEQVSVKRLFIDMNQQNVTVGMNNAAGSQESLPKITSQAIYVRCDKYQQSNEMFPNSSHDAELEATEQTRLSDNTRTDTKNVQNANDKHDLPYGNESSHTELLEIIRHLISKYQEIKRFRPSFQKVCFTEIAAKHETDYEAIQELYENLLIFQKDYEKYVFSKNILTSVYKLVKEYLKLLRKSVIKNSAWLDLTCTCFPSASFLPQSSGCIAECISSHSKPPAVQSDPVQTLSSMHGSALSMKQASACSKVSHTTLKKPCDTKQPMYCSEISSTAPAAGQASQPPGGDAPISFRPQGYGSSLQTTCATDLHQSNARKEPSTCSSSTLRLQLPKASTNCNLEQDALEKSSRSSLLSSCVTVPRGMSDAENQELLRIQRENMMLANVFRDMKTFRTGFLASLSKKTNSMSNQSSYM